MADDPQRQLDEANVPRAASLAERPPARFAFLDGLRGLAALGIVVYHIWRYEPLPYPAMNCLPWIVDWTLLRSWGGIARWSLVGLVESSAARCLRSWM